MMKRLLTAAVLAAITLLPAAAQFRPTVTAQSEAETATGAVDWLVGPITETTPSANVLRVPEYPQVHSVQVEVTNEPASCTIELEGSLVLSPVTWPSLSGSQTCTNGVLFHVVNKAATYLRANITALTETEVLSETDFATHANWDVTGDFVDTGGNAAYTHSTGSGTLTQTEANQANAPTSGSREYNFDYTVSGFSGDVACDITTAWAATTTALTMSDGAQTTTFTSASNPGDFVISCTSSSGGVTLDDFSLTSTPTATVYYVGLGQ